MKLEYENLRVIENYKWNEFISSIYNLPYNYQQQNDRQNTNFEFNIPNDLEEEDLGSDSIPYEVNGEDECVKFDTWKNSDFEEIGKNFEYEVETKLFYERNFYPSIFQILNDLYNRGLIEEGDYLIRID